MSGNATGRRCAAAHAEDPTPCDGGPGDAVEIRDQHMPRSQNTGVVGVLGCVHHGARMLASLDAGRVYPGPGHREQGHAIACYRTEGGEDR